MSSLCRKGGRDGSGAEVVGGLLVAAVGLHAAVVGNLGRICRVILSSNGNSSSS